MIINIKIIIIVIIRGGAIAAGATVTTSSGKQILSRSFTTLRVAVAGGIAGATGTLAPAHRPCRF